MKKIFTFAAAVLASFSLWAATESNPTSASKDTDVAGTSYTIPGTFVAGAGSAKVGAMPDKGIKFRLNKPAGDLSNAIEFTVNEGYVINAIQLIGITNSDNKAATVGSIYVDGVAWNGTFNGALPAKNAEAASDIQITGIEAAQSVVFVFSDLGGANQGNICYTVTYEEAVQKEVDHVDVTLGGVAVNGEALSGTQMATLYGAFSLDLTAEYVEAPTVTFTVQTDTYYVGETEPSTKNEDVDVVAALNPDGKWQAQQTVGEQTYTITAVKPATATVTYMDGAAVLGTETVKVGEPATKYADYQKKTLAEFQGWYTDAELTAAADLNAAINEDQTLYGKFVKAYISANVNIEQLVLDYGTKYDIQSALTAAGWDFENLNSLDTLNDLENKPNRNEPYLGLKLKTAGAYLQGWIPVDGGVVIKFGNLGSDIKVTITGANTNLEQTFTAANLAEMGNEFPIWGFTEEVLVKISTVSGGTVVLKQLMLINEGIQEVTLPAPGAYLITIAESENGTVTADWADKKYRTPVGETVTLTVTPAEGYKVGTVTVNEVALEAVEGVYSFVMPAQEVTVSATFEVDPASAISNTNANVKAVKVVRNGQLFIEKNGVVYNAQGAIVK